MNISEAVRQLKDQASSKETSSQQNTYNALVEQLGTGPLPKGIKWNLLF